MRLLQWVIFSWECLHKSEPVFHTSVPVNTISSHLIIFIIALFEGVVYFEVNLIWTMLENSGDHKTMHSGLLTRSLISLQHHKLLTVIDLKTINSSSTETLIYGPYKDNKFMISDDGTPWHPTSNYFLRLLWDVFQKIQLQTLLHVIFVVFIELSAFRHATSSYFPHCILYKNCELQSSIWQAPLDSVY